MWSFSNVLMLTLNEHPLDCHELQKLSGQLNSHSLSGCFLHLGHLQSCRPLRQGPMPQAQSGRVDSGSCSAVKQCFQALRPIFPSPHVFAVLAVLCIEVLFYHRRRTEKSKVQFPGSVFMYMHAKQLLLLMLMLMRLMLMLTRQRANTMNQEQVLREADEF